MLAAGLMLGGLSSAQTATKPTAPSPKTSPAPSRRECLSAAGFCIQVPTGWQRLGEVFDGNGFVVAEPNPKRPKEQWSQITATVIPTQQESQERSNIDELINLVIGSPAEGTTQQTLQRSRETVAGNDAQIVQIRIRSGASERIEEVAFIDTDQGVYSIAMSSAPEDAPKLQPVFRQVLSSWKPYTPAPSPQR